MFTQAIKKTVEEDINATVKDFAALLGAQIWNRHNGQGCRFTRLMLNPLLSTVKPGSSETLNIPKKCMSITLDCTGVPCLCLKLRPRLHASGCF